MQLPKIFFTYSNTPRIFVELPANTIRQCVVKRTSSRLKKRFSKNNVFPSPPQ